jgi:hypothetical protein
MTDATTDVDRMHDALDTISDVTGVHITGGGQDCDGPYARLTLDEAEALAASLNHLHRTGKRDLREPNDNVKRRTLMTTNETADVRLHHARCDAVAGTLTPAGAELLALHHAGITPEVLWGDLMAAVNTVAETGKKCQDEDARTVLVGLVAWLSQRLADDQFAAWEKDREARTEYEQRLAVGWAMHLLQENGVRAVPLVDDETVPTVDVQALGQPLWLRYGTVRVNVDQRDSGDGVGVLVDTDPSNPDNAYGPAGLVVAVNDGYVYRNVDDDLDNVIVPDDSHRTLIEVAYNEDGYGEDGDEPGWSVYSRSDRMGDFVRHDGNETELADLLSIAHDVVTGD